MHAPEGLGLGSNNYPFGPVLRGLYPCRVEVNFVEDYSIFISADGGVRGGNLPVWSVYKVRDMSCIMMIMSCWRLLVLVPSSCSSLACACLVYLTPWRWPRMWSFWVSSELVKKLWTFLMLMRGQERYFPWRMALIHVLFVGKPDSPWRYWMTGSRLRISHT